MDGTRVDRWTRRMFGLALSGATASLLGGANTSATKHHNDRRGSGHDHQKGPVQADKKKKKKLQPGSAGPAGLPGPPGPPGPAPTTLATRVLASLPSDLLGTTPGDVVSAVADCGGPGRAVDCGFFTGATPAQLVNVFLKQVRALDDGSGCRAEMVRTVAAGSTGGARIQAIATCLN
jgi:hypothetical protein